MRKREVRLLMICFFVTAHASLAGASNNWYVSPTGTSSGTGTLESPWDLQTALCQPSVVGPGDTIWLTEGTYVHPDRSGGTYGFNMQLKGTETAPITVRNYNGGRATLDGGLQAAGEGYANHVRVHGLEILVSEKVGQTSYEGRLAGPAGQVWLSNAHDIKIINCYIHDNLQGISMWGNVGGGSEAYGNIIYNNGWLPNPDDPSDREHGHAVYTQNASGDYKYFRDNLILDNYVFAFQAYGSSNATIEDFWIEGNTFLPDWKGTSEYDEWDGWQEQGFLFGGGYGSGNKNAEIRDNIFYRVEVRIGYIRPAHNVRLINNHILRRDLNVVEGSTLIKQSGNVIWAQPPWRDERNPPKDIVELRPNAYDKSRANLTLVQPTRSEVTIAVDFSRLMKPGDSYRIVDVKDYYGVPVHTGVYSGGAVSIPIGGREISVYVVLIEGS